MIKTEIKSTVNSLNKFRHDQLNTTVTIKISQPSQLMGGPSHASKISTYSAKTEPRGMCRISSTSLLREVVRSV